MRTNHITDSLTDWIPSQLKASYSYSCTSARYLTLGSIRCCPQFNQADAGKEQYRGAYSGV